MLRRDDLTRRERQRVLEAVSGDIRKYTDLVEAGASDAALAVAKESGIALQGMGWHDQNKFDRGRVKFILEHAIPVKAVRARCLAAESVDAVAAALGDVVVAWILRGENASLNVLGFQSNRPDPRAAYRAAGIALSGFTDTDPTDDGPKVD